MFLFSILLLPAIFFMSCLFLTREQASARFSGFIVGFIVSIVLYSVIAFAIPYSKVTSFNMVKIFGFYFSQRIVIPFVISVLLAVLQFIFARRIYSYQYLIGVFFGFWTIVLPFYVFNDNSFMTMFPAFLNPLLYMSLLLLLDVFITCIATPSNFFLKLLSLIFIFVSLFIPTLCETLWSMNKASAFNYLVILFYISISVSLYFVVRIKPSK